MSAPKAMVRKGYNDTWMSWCSAADIGITYSSTQQGALRNGLAHLAAHHTAQMPPVAHGDPDGLNVAHNAIQRAYDTTRSTT